MLVESLVKESRSKDKKIIKKNRDNMNYWSNVLARYYIYSVAGSNDIDSLYKGFNENVKNLKDYLDKIIIGKNHEDKKQKINKRINDLSKRLVSISDNKTNYIFFNDRPIVIYKDEVEKIKEVGTKFTYYDPKDRCSKPSIVQKYLFVWLVWQKAYNNQFIVAPEWAKAKDEQLFDYVEDKKKSQSGQRCKNLKTLIDEGYLSYKMICGIEPRKRYPDRLYKVNFIQQEGEDAFIIIDYRHLYEHYLKYIGEKYEFCEKCGQLFEYERASRKYCDKCAR